MSELFQYWYLFPVSILIATVAMATGIGGAVFFSPIFLVALKLRPEIAIGTALLTELFGFTSGLIAYSRARLIDYSLARKLLLVSIPTAIVGVIMADYIPGVVLKTIFATGLIFIGWQLYSSWREDEKQKLDSAIEADFAKKFESELTDATGRVFRYTVCHKDMGMLFAGIGGTFLGMISVGLAELQEYHLVSRCRVPSPVAIGTSIFVVVVTVFIAVSGHLFSFVNRALNQGDSSALWEVVGLAIYTVPGVLIGGQLGPKLQQRLNPDHIKAGLALLFILTGFFTYFTLR